MQIPYWQTTTKTCANTWPSADGVWTSCEGQLAEWQQLHPHTGILMMTCWHCRECGNDTFRAEPAPGSPLALARKVALHTSASATNGA